MPAVTRGVTGGSPAVSLYLVSETAETFLLICKESIEGDIKGSCHIFSHSTARYDLFHPNLEENQSKGLMMMRVSKDY